MARIYTRTGDDGDTSLGDGSRSPKSGPRVDLYGEVDELNSVVGCCVAALRRSDQPVPDGLPGALQTIQSRLFDLGAVLANPGQSTELAAMPAEEQPFPAADLEGLIDGLDAILEPLRTFVLPGGTEAAGFLHLARTVCRRAERKAVALAGDEPVPAGAIVYLNRLSDFLFTAARAVNTAAGVDDIPWTGSQGGA
jgi:cob(I)alamin adenosyltransferase